MKIDVHLLFWLEEGFKQEKVENVHSFVFFLKVLICGPSTDEIWGFNISKVKVSQIFPNSQNFLFIFPTWVYLTPHMYVVRILIQKNGLWKVKSQGHNSWFCKNCYISDYEVRILTIFNWHIFLATFTSCVDWQQFVFEYNLLNDTDVWESSTCRFLIV